MAALFAISQSNQEGPGDQEKSDSLFHPPSYYGGAKGNAAANGGGGGGGAQRRPERGYNANHQATIYHIIRKTVNDCIMTSTMHGMPKVISSESIILKIMWIICFLGSTAFCLWLVVVSIQDYLEYEVVTKIESVTEIPSVFPAVTICDMSAYTTSAAHTYVQTVLTANGLGTILTGPSIFANNLLSFTFATYITGMNALNPAVSDTVRKTYGIDLSSKLISCIYNAEPCTADDFEWYYHFMYGNCYKFNGGKYANGSAAETRVVTRSGLVNGLIMELFIDDETNINSVSQSSGAHVIVHNKSIIPAFTEGIRVPTGAFTAVAVRRAFLYRLSDPYSACTDMSVIKASSSVYVQTVISKYGHYRQVDCYAACYQRTVIKNCTCQDLTSPIIDESVPYCLNFLQVYCSASSYITFYSGDVSEACSECPLECDSISYYTSSSASRYPNEGYYQKLLTNPVVLAQYNNDVSSVTYEELSRKVLGLNINYDDLSYIMITEVEKTNIIDLVSMIGGTLGLFVGVSFLSFVELLDMAVTILFNVAAILLLARDKNKKKKQMLASRSNLVSSSPLSVDPIKIDP